MIYWLNPDYKFREELWGSIAYFLEDTSWEIGRKGTEILSILNGKTPEEVSRILDLSEKEVNKFITQCIARNLVITTEPDKKSFLKKNNFKDDSCLSAPLGLFFEITYNCNLKCSHCYTSSNSREASKELTTGEIFSLIDDSAEEGVFVISIGGGEPFLRKDLYEILKYGSNKEIEMIPVTNRLFINEKSIEKLKLTGIKQIVVSLDGANPETYKEIRGVNLFHKVVNSIKMLTDAGFRVFINCVVTKVNLHEIEEMIKLAKSLNVRAIRFIRLTLFGRANENKKLWLETEDYMYFVKKLMELSKQYSSQKFNVLKDEAFLGLFDSISIKKRISWLDDKYRGCPAARSFLFIDPYGNVYPCGYLELEEFFISNLRKNNLKDIWRNKIQSKTLDLFRKMAKLNDYCESCKNKIMCQGGCRGTAYLKYNSILAPDSLCFRNIIENKLDIRIFKAGDEKEISNIICRNLREVNKKDYTKEIIESLLKDYTPKKVLEKSKQGKFLLAIQNGRIVGVGRFYKGVIYDVFVLPEKHKKRIGTIIMESLEDEAKHKKFDKIKIPSSKTALNFYKKLGYKKFDFKQKSKSSIWMRKCIN